MLSHQVARRLARLAPHSRAFSNEKVGMSQVPAVDESIQKIASTFRNHFVSKLTKPRTVGREAEFPVVNAADGSAADVRKLLARMDEDGDLKLKQMGDHGLYGAEYEYRCVLRECVRARARVRSGVLPSAFTCFLNDGRGRGRGSVGGRF